MTLLFEQGEPPEHASPRKTPFSLSPTSRTARSTPGSDFFFDDDEMDAVLEAQRLEDAKAPSGNYSLTLSIDSKKRGRTVCSRVTAK